MGFHRGCSGRRDVWVVLGRSVVHGMLQEGCVGYWVVRGMRWDSLLCGGVCGVPWVVGALGSAVWRAVRCSTGAICAALRCVKVPSGRAVEEDNVGWTREVVVRFQSQ